MKERKLLATGATFLFAIPFTLLVNIILSRMIGGPVIDVWDILSVFILLVIAVAFIIGDYAHKKGIQDKSSYIARQIPACRDDKIPVLQ